MAKPSSAEKNVFSPQPHLPNQFEGMLGVSLPMLEVFQRIIDAASADIPVLITGETGTGKDLVAGAISQSKQKKRQTLCRRKHGSHASRVDSQRTIWP